MAPTPTITSVLPVTVALNACSHRARRWFVTWNGMRLFSMRMAVAANSPAFGACTPLLLVSTAAGGSQVSGRTCSMPAPIRWTHRRRGARRARSSRENSHPMTTSAVRSASSNPSRSQPMVRSRWRASAG